MAAVGLCGIVSHRADPITSIPETKATLLRSIKPMTKTRAPVTRKMGCQCVRANRRMPTIDSRAAVRSHRRSRRGRAGLAARDLPAGVDGFYGGKLRRCDRSLMAASYPPGGRYRVLPCLYLIVGFPGASLHLVRSNGCLSSRGSAARGIASRALELLRARPEGHHRRNHPAEGLAPSPELAPPQVTSIAAHKTARACEGSIEAGWLLVCLWALLGGRNRDTSSWCGFGGRKQDGCAEADQADKGQDNHGDPVGPAGVGQAGDQDGACDRGADR
jgi:hypothetical protein